MVKKPLLIYDGHCGFCRHWVECTQKRVGEAIDFAPSQDVADQYPHISPEAFEQSVQLVAPNGSVQSGALAIFSVLSYHSKFWSIALWKYKYIPGFAALSEWVYRLVAKHRSTICSV